MEGDAVDGPVVCVSRGGATGIIWSENRKAPGASEVSLELIAASGGVGIQVMAEICQKLLGEFGMPVECALSIVVPIFRRKGNIRNFSFYRAVKLHEH